MYSTREYIADLGALSIRSPNVSNALVFIFLVRYCWLVRASDPRPDRAAGFVDLIFEAELV